MPGHSLRIKIPRLPPSRSKRVGSEARAHGPRLALRGLSVSRAG